MMMNVAPQAEHVWLQRLVGDWEGVSDTPDPEGNVSPPWTETGRMLGEIWLVVEGQGVMGDKPSQTLMQLGYDPERGRFVGTWIGSMMNHMWIYEGTLDGDVLTLDCEGPDFAEKGRTAKYQDIITLEGDDRRTLRSRMLGKEGQWAEVMHAEYRRKR